ncbi:MAG: GAF domain-containing protein, partial [Chloroflexi bacterium]|nr:GAF domain-containing protein [Chloroflexota bacterium]
TQRAHQAQRQLAEENAVMAEIGRIVNSSLDIDEVYQRIGSQVGKLVDFDRLTINLIDRENGTATSTFITGIYIPEIPTGRVFQLSGSSSGLAASTKVTQLILPQSEQELADLFPPMVAAYQAGIKSFMLVPLLSQGEVVAVMRIQSFEANAYNENDARIAELVGAQIAGAIANASLYLRQVVADAEIKDLAKFPSENPNPVARISAGGMVIYANDAASKLLTGRDLEAGDSTLESWRELAEEALANDTPKEAEIDYGTRIISYSLVPVPDAGYVNIYGRDITEAKEVERLKDEFISTVSHELRTPLTSIKGAAEILLNYPDEDPATQAEFLGIIDSESDRLTRLINDVLDLARLDSGQMRWHMSQADLVSVIGTAVDSTHALTVQKNVTVKIGSADGLPPFESDTDKLVQVLTNLLSNAIKFTPSGGLICVRTRLLPNLDPKTGVKMAEVSVSDNGVGIPATELDNIFNRFQQVGTTLSDRPQGTGLGLAISKEIVAHLGGEIWVESQLGKGSTFFFTIPVAQTSN